MRQEKHVSVKEVTLNINNVVACFRKNLLNYTVQVFEVSDNKNVFVQWYDVRVCKYMYNLT